MLKSLIAIIPLLVVPAVHAGTCISFDTAWNLYAFGGDNDVNLGASSSWSSPSPTNLPTTGRPPWTGESPQCMLNQNSNALYVLGADASDLSKLYIYDFGASSWSVQSTSATPDNLGGPSGSSLDHDTNVIFTLPSSSGDGSLWQLDLGTPGVTTAAQGSALAWEAVSSPPFTMSGYTPTLGAASNHINFFGVPNTSAGLAEMFVIHYAYWQPEPASYSGDAFPDTAGQAVSVPDKDNNVPLQVLFVPNGANSAYLVTHWTDPGNYATTSTAPFAANLINSTQALGSLPSTSDANARYAASPESVVALLSTGQLAYIANAVGSDRTVQSTSWTVSSFSYGGTGANASSSASSSASMSGSSTGSASATGTGMSSTSGRPSGSASGSGTAASSTPSGAASSTLSRDMGALVFATSVLTWALAVL